MKTKMLSLDYIEMCNVPFATSYCRSNFQIEIHHLEPHKDM